MLVISVVQTQLTSWLAAIFACKSLRLTFVYTLPLTVPVLPLATLGQRIVLLFEARLNWLKAIVVAKNATNTQKILRDDNL